MLRDIANYTFVVAAESIDLAKRFGLCLCE